MLAAIHTAEANQTPFGAALAMGDEVFATSANQTKESENPEVHAEINVIRKVKDQTRKKDLSGFILYSTCKSSAVCMNEISGSGIKTIVYGCGIEIVKKYLNRFDVQTNEVNSESVNDIERIGSFMEAECEDLLRKFS